MDQTRTTTRLLDGLAGQDRSCWEDFDRRYRPVIAAVCVRLGVPNSDAADIAQETLLAFLKDLRGGKYDRGRGRLRAWLAGITRRRIADHFRVRREQCLGSWVPEEPGDDVVARTWESEQREEILREALHQVQVSSRTTDITWRAFELTALRDFPIDAAASELGVTAQDVYLARSRVLARVREAAARLAVEHEDDA